jgi:hypothetical protein
MYIPTTRSLIKVYFFGRYQFSLTWNKIPWTKEVIIKTDEGSVCSTTTIKNKSTSLHFEKAYNRWVFVLGRLAFGYTDNSKPPFKLGEGAIRSAISLPYSNSGFDH